MGDWPADKVERVSVKSLVPYANNARTHSNEQIAQIMASIREWGFTTPILRDESGMVIAGHGRLLAAMRLKLDEVPVVTAAGWTDSQKRAYVIADNRLALSAGWDEDLLAGEIGDLDEAGFDLDLIGFDDGEIEDLLAGEDDADAGADTEPQEDRAEELREKWGVETGQLWQLGEHRLLCGDSTKADDVALVMGGDKARIVVTSPPYNQSLDKFQPSGMHGSKESNWVKNISNGSYFDSKPEDEYQLEQATAILLWKEFLTDDGSIFYNHKNRYREKQVVSPWTWIAKTGAKVRQEIIWARPGSVTQNARMFLPCDERIYWMYFGDNFFFDGLTEHKTWSSVWNITPNIDREASLHGCAFPLDIVSRPLMACSSVNDVCFEPYNGSGTTIIACENLKRKCRAIEISPAYVAVALQRWADHAGGEPKLING